ncbi:uncharacterized protein [Neodiprion pinetum]|uniref:uncharacterized protein n=1 Tax=Neodiprion pinetum TaxID=441929 RepID=UPI003723AAC7
MHSETIRQDYAVTAPLFSDRLDLQGNGDDGVATPRSPIDILDEYSKVCGLSVEYKNLSPSYSYSKNVKVKCCFAGFTFDACSDSRKSAKTSAAAKTLLALASRQIDEENIGELTPFSRKQIEEILGLNTRCGHETPIMKLYKICMQLDAPEPVYHSLQESSNVVGSRYTIKCDALGYSKSGWSFY